MSRSVEVMVGKTPSRSWTEIAEAEKISKSYVSRILWLALLAPDLVEAVLHGRADQRMMLQQLEQPLPRLLSGFEYGGRPSCVASRALDPTGPVA